VISDLSLTRANDTYIVGLDLTIGTLLDTSGINGWSIALQGGSGNGGTNNSGGNNGPKLYCN